MVCASAEDIVSSLEQCGHKSDFQVVIVFMRYARALGAGRDTKLASHRRAARLASTFWLSIESIVDVSVK